MFDFRRSPSSAARYRSWLGRHTCWGDFRLDCEFGRRDAATVETSVGWTKWTFCRVSPLRRRTCALSSSKLVFVMHMIQVGNCLPQSKGGNEVAEAAAGPRVGRLFLAARLVWDHLPPCFGVGKRASGAYNALMGWGGGLEAMHGDFWGPRLALGCGGGGRCCCEPGAWGDGARRGALGKR